MFFWFAIRNLFRPKESDTTTATATLSTSANSYGGIAPPCASGTSTTARVNYARHTCATVTAAHA